MTQRTACCSCGQLYAKVLADPVRVSICHCLACQRRTGSVFGAQARFPRAGVTTTGRSSTWERTGETGTKFTFHFCPDCGATVHYYAEGLEDFVSIPVGAFADPGFPAPGYSIYEDRKHAWVSVPADIEHVP